MLAGMVSYGALRERGPEGVELSEVQVAVPTGMRAPISIDRIVVSELDLEGLAATGDPARFVLRIEGIDYAALVEAGQGLPLPQLPDLSGVPGLSLAMSLLPPDDDPLAREAAVDLVLDGQFAVGLDARLDLHGLAPDALEAAPTREMSVSFENRGFLGTLLREQARAAGMEREAMVATALEGLAEAFAPLEPGSLQERLVAVLGEALADPDRPGVIRLALSTEEAGGLRPILEALQVDPAASDRLAFDLSFQPLP
jgi:hypothetical protein